MFKHNYLNIDLDNKDIFNYIYIYIYIPEFKD